MLTMQFQFFKTKQNNNHDDNNNFQKLQKNWG